MSEKQFSAGTLIFKEGDPSDCAYIIQSGKVEILKKAQHGDVQIAILEAGAPFGEMGLFDGNPRGASARALETTNVDIVSAADLNNLVDSSPPRLAPIIHAVFDRLRVANKRVSEQNKASQVVECDFQTITLLPTNSDVGLSFDPIEVPVVQLPFRICGYPKDKQPEDLARNRLNIPCEETPLTVSRSHLDIELLDGVVYVTDTGSRFGTYIGDVPIGRGKGLYKIPLTRGDTKVTLGGKNSPYSLVLRCA